MGDDVSIESMIDALEDVGASEGTFILDVIKDYYSYHLEIKVSKMD